MSEPARPPTALVTGAAGGLGSAVAGRLHDEGWLVALVDVADAVHLVAERLAAGRSGGGVVAFEGDVADEAFVDGAVAAAQRELGPLALLVNAAGIGGDVLPAAQTSTANFRRVLEVNVVGSFVAARAAARAMSAHCGGCIVNFGSIFGQQAVAGSSAYCASKGAITLLTQALALELAANGIRVNTIAPGHIATDMHWDNLRGQAKEKGTRFEEEVERVRAGIPLGRHGTGEDIAAVVSWLASDAAAYITGQTIGVNGGVMLT
jgi:NAD(P)-dependent dehydrogenase (short-subunit alcohol dehydrogenase family)